MKIGQGAQSAPRGSFGIPPEVHPDVLAKKRADAEAVKAEAKADAKAQVDQGFDVPETEGGDAALSAQAQTALGQLRTMGVEMAGDDWSALFYKGFIEKTIVIGKIPDPETKTLQDFTMTVRTLTAEETDEADELFAHEIRESEMTREGVQNRRQMWNFAYALQRINGVELCKPVLMEVGKKQVINRKKTAEAKRRVIAQMAPLILKQASLKFSRFMELLDTLVAEPNQAFFDKP